jgi:hypothetical protein
MFALFVRLSQSKTEGCMHFIHARFELGIINGEWAANMDWCTCMQIGNHDCCARMNLGNGLVVKLAHLLRSK